MFLDHHRKQFKAVCGLIALLASGAGGQTVSGRVVDSTTRTPLTGVTITLLEGTTAAASVRTNDSGRFEVRAPRAGEYTLQLRLLGHAPRVFPLPLRDGDRLTPVYALLRIPTDLDTMVTRADQPLPSLLGVSAGRDVYRRHMERGIGQFVTGFEIQRSRLSLLEYLATIPGLRLATSVPEPDTRGDSPNSPPTIAERNGKFLLSTRDGSGCLYARIDHWSMPHLFDAANTIFLDDLVEVEDVRAVEVYQPGENPPEWAFEGVQNLMMVTQEFVSYFIGSTRNSMTRITGADMSRRQRVRHPPNDVLTVYDLPWMTSPRCTFVQIWTRISW